MKAKTLSLVAMLAALTTIHAGARAAAPEQPLVWMEGKDGCHVLLTEQECASHREALARIASLAQRYAYLDGHGISLREREALCSCKRNTPATVFYPQRALRVAQR